MYVFSFSKFPVHGTLLEYNFVILLCLSTNLALKCLLAHREVNFI
jgi:hypothetical protein